jgi:hypothetical protein
MKRNEAMTTITDIPPELRVEYDYSALYVFHSLKTPASG